MSFSFFAMSKFIKQRICIKFCLRNQFSAVDTLRMVQKAFGDEAMSKKNVYKWFTVQIDKGIVEGCV